MREHTPGPWYVAPNGLIMSKKGVIIGTVHTCADDYLIAAAPDLLEAAKAVVNKVMRAGFAKTCLDDTGIHEAIAKANGESPEPAKDHTTAF